MSAPVDRAGRILAIAAGLGLLYIAGHALMTGDGLAAILGAILALLGAVALAFGLRGEPSSSRIW